MKKLLNLVENNIVDKVNGIDRVVEFSCRKYTREIYIDGFVYEEDRIDLIFLVDKGEWFNNIIRFDITINNYCDRIVVRKGYGNDYSEYKRTSFKDVVRYVYDEVYSYSIDNLKKLNEVEIC